MVAALFLFVYSAGAQTSGPIVVNRLGTGSSATAAGQCIAITTGAAVEILKGGTHRYAACFICTVPVSVVFSGSKLGVDTAPPTEPTSTIGYPIATATQTCEQSGVPVTMGQSAVQARMDAISTSGSGTCCTREMQ